MSDKYLFNQRGKVEELYLPGKAILIFNYNNKAQRALLWVKCYAHQGKLLDKTESFAGKLSIGDILYFDCHIYDKESSDNCQWYAARAAKEPAGANNAKPVVFKLISKNGNISELEPGKGVIVFDFYDEEDRVFFLRSKFYMFGKRPAGNKKSLKEFLSEDDPLQFDADRCEPSEENFHCRWFATLVWKGKKPVVSSSGSQEHRFMDDLTPDDSASNIGGATRELTIDRDDFPVLPTHNTIHHNHTSKKLGIKAFEGSNTVKDGRGKVIRLFNEECGLALWMVACNAWETVFFHRREAFLDTFSLEKFDLHESLSEGCALEISAVPATPEFPCRWIARRVVARY